MNNSEEIAEKFKKLGKVKVKEIMSTEISTLNEDEEFFNFVDKIKTKGYFGFPVVNKHDEISGVVTWSDLLKLVLFHGSRCVKMLEADPITGTTLIRNIMSTHPVCLSPEDTVEDAVSIMVEYKIQSIPVVHDKTVVGILGKRDILDEIFEMLESVFDNSKKI